MVHERDRADRMGYADPIQPSAEATHASYDSVLKRLLLHGERRISPKCGVRPRVCLVCHIMNPHSVAAPHSTLPRANGAGAGDPQPGFG